MKRILGNLIIAVMVIVGIAALGYPVLANMISSFHHGKAIEEYQMTVEQYNAIQMQEERAKAETYNDGLNGQVAKDPFIEGSGYTLPENYLDCLDFNGIMGTLVIPKINVDLPIYHGTSDEVLRKGVGHIKETSLPIGGDGSHAVLTSHSGLSDAKLFTDLNKLVEGDTFEIHVLGEVLYYKVNQIKVVEPNQTEELSRVPGKDYVTLLTCTPIGVNSHRLLVRGERYYPEESVEESDTGINMQYVALAVGMLVVTTTTLLIVNRFNKMKK